MTRPLSDSLNPGAGLRARAELIRNPARSDRLIAQAARCEHKLVHRTRRELEDAWLIRRVPRAQRKGRTPPPRQPGRARLAIEAGAASAAEVARQTGLTYQAAWQAFRLHEREHQAALGAVLQGKIRPCCPVMPGGEPGFPTGWLRETPAALNLCRRYCPVTSQCAQWALTLPDDDPRVYAGMTKAQRVGRKAAR